MTQTPTPIDQADIADLRARIRGDVLRPSQEGYATVGFNPAVSRRPWAVIDAADAHDVAAAVSFAADNSMTVAVHATGHGATSVDGKSLLVRTAALDTCDVDPDTRTARIGAGVRWQRVIDAAAPYGLAPLCGSAPGVGVAGFLSGGGIGPLVRTVGVSSDYVRAFEVVTGDGRLRRVTADVDPDLFWGLRGGKSTLGIITEVEVELLPIAQFYGGAVYFDGADASAVLAAWKRWAQELPREASTSVAFLRLPDMPGVPPMLAGKLTVAVRYASVADVDTAAATFAPMRAVATPILDMVDTMPYAAVGMIHADPTDPLPTHDDGILLSDLTDEAVTTLLRHVGPAAASPLLVVELRLLGGAFAEQRGPDSAVCHRDAAVNLHIIGALVGPIADIVPEHATRLVGDMSAWATGGRLPNFTASADPRTVRSCYDEETAAWLAALARQHDPCGALAVGQVVR
ncbi:FAD-binding oxidoreductase [Gordonia otitidis]|uniref:FAD-binding oxidoreductase n=1 Tax=Gordonia otitidis TaxID=249058 RepID=UPI001D144E6B|nr:FAD-binding oxidoreductase [Gordonia otitidis]UEA58464.1 FAD-binding oxidoreductase [Gordonia otitidis]